MYREFGEYVRELRRKVDPPLTLSEAAEKLGIKPPYLSRIEAGLERPPALEKLEKMSELYNVPINQLIEKASNRAKEVYGDKIFENPALHVLYKIVRDLPEEEIIKAIEKVCGQMGIEPQKFIEEINEKKKMQNQLPKNNLPKLNRIQEYLFAPQIPRRRLSKVDIEQITYAFLARHGFTKEQYLPPTDIENLIEDEQSIRFRIYDSMKLFRNGEPMELGMSYWSPYQEDIREINVSYALIEGEHSSKFRFRYTIAHELFHCIEHLPLIDKKDRMASSLNRLIAEYVPVQDTARTQAKKRTVIDKWIEKPNKPKQLFSLEDWREWQANYFAACLLMPEWSVRAEFKRRFGNEEIVVSDENIKQVAYQAAQETLCPTGVYKHSLNKLYEVSAQAMAIRLMGLGLVRD